MPKILPGLSSRTLARNEVHVWSADLDCAGASIHEYESILSTDEKTRASKFHFERDRQRFVACRGILRAILGAYLGSDPARIDFCYNYYGKPALRRGAAHDFRFNLSHTGAHAAFAVTHGRDVGIDIEEIRSEVEIEPLFERYFSPAEADSLRSLPSCQQRAAFFTCWTRKEAFVKAKGTGLSIALDRFDVATRPNESSALLRVEWDERETSRWRLFDLNIASGVAGSLAVYGHDWNIREFHWMVEETMA